MASRHRKDPGAFLAGILFLFIAVNHLAGGLTLPYAVPLTAAGISLAILVTWATRARVRERRGGRVRR